MWQRNMCKWHGCINHFGLNRTIKYFKIPWIFASSAEYLMIVELDEWLWRANVHCFFIRSVGFQNNRYFVYKFYDNFPRNFSFYGTFFCFFANLFIVSIAVSFMPFWRQICDQTWKNIIYDDWYNNPIII